ncbi:MAG TPA: hypothetical protein VH519_12130 [Hyphomicrobiaceae bacterium]|jgi:hypothetical protein
MILASPGNFKRARGRRVAPIGASRALIRQPAEYAIHSDTSLASDSLRQAMGQSRFRA